MLDYEGQGLAGAAAANADPRTAGRNRQLQEIAAAMTPDEVFALIGPKPSGYGASYQPSDDQRAMRAAAIKMQSMGPGGGFAPLGDERRRSASAPRTSSSSASSAGGFMGVGRL